MSLRNYLNKLKKHYPFSKEEFTGLLIGIFVLALIHSWDQWGVERFDATAGISNLLTSLIYLTITVLVHHTGQRMMALKLGYKATHTLWWHGAIIGLLLVMLSNGNITFLAISGTSITLLTAHRIGAFRYGPNISDVARVALAGPIANILFAGLIKTLNWMALFPTGLADTLFVLNLAFAGWNLLPIPPLDGAKVFYFSRLTYAFLFGTIASYVLLIFAFDIYSYLLALLIGSITWLLFYLFFERKW